MSIDEFAKQYATPQYLVPMAIAGGIGGLVRGRTGAVVGALIGALLGGYVLPQTERVVVLGERYANESGQWRNDLAAQSKVLQGKINEINSVLLNASQNVSKFNIFGQ